MNVILHDLTAAEADGIFPDTAEIISNNGTIQNCIGCFGCWIKTPGKCVLKDGYENMGKLLAQADKLTIVSRCCYGSYSPFVKNVIDRSISYLLPFFRTIHNETHHKPRYKKRLSLSVHFYGEKITLPEKRTAENLVAANCVNFNIREYKVTFSENLNELLEVIQ